jgi:hypothetical protein
MLKRPKSSEHKADQVEADLLTGAHGRVKRFHGTDFDETIFFFQEATLVAHEGGLKRTPVRVVRQWSTKEKFGGLSKQV